MQKLIAIVLCGVLVAGCGGSGSSGGHSSAKAKEAIEDFFGGLFGAMLGGMFGAGALTAVPETGLAKARHYVSGFEKTLIIEANGDVGTFDLVITNEAGDLVAARHGVPADAGLIEVAVSDDRRDEYWISTFQYYDYVGTIDVSLEGVRGSVEEADGGDAQ